MKKIENEAMRKAIFYNGAQLAAELGVSQGYVYAMRRAMGLTGRSRYMRLETTLKWMEAHPEFTTRSAYSGGGSK